MRRVLIASFATFLLFGIKSCGEPYGAAKDTVEEFLEEVKDKKGQEALRYLHPTFRDSLAKEVKLPIELTELKPSQVLACFLSSMGANIDEIKVMEGKPLGKENAMVKVKVVDGSGIEKLFNFVLIKEGDKWLIVDITPYKPEIKKEQKEK
ncbi:uncharacterized protein DUF4878 [Hydrogenivirga caldilitoris]|uniref:Uncharacterized protein DUF4878 n=1 Tax=Hydrogenivirga caldilitoris TaxID=246264 RepID=A0A497XR10_9AQUI|nr:DUF4878 domain-containing protein [Hydrogenivirga caldilitoris]RLJ70610.1 uncharacterized protein DUF4878 [Hydrogenivirga caldilitoris]